VRVCGERERERECVCVCVCVCVFRCECSVCVTVRSYLRGRREKGGSPSGLKAPGLSVKNFAEYAYQLILYSVRLTFVPH
jgi:hypothetical protein